MRRAGRAGIIAAALLAGQEPGANRILAPPGEAVFEKGPVRLIVMTAANSAPLLDGKPVPLTSPFPGVGTAEVNPGPGVHEVSLGEEKVKFAVGAAPAGWKAFRDHLPVSQCQTCHAVRNGQWRFARASLATVCSACHNKETFPVQHTHAMGMMADCQMCHLPHGSTAKGHMKLERDKACKLCHS